MILSFAITYALLISQDKAVNSFEVGQNTIEVVEEYEPPEEITGGTVIVKKPYVKNKGNLPCFVRMRADFSDSKAIEFCEEIKINDKWEYNTKDGYYYYKEVLKVGEETEYLFEEIKIKEFKENGTDSYTKANMIDFDINIYAESIQHTDHEGECEQEEYKTVWLWN